ncbi:hypothetical protein [Mycobacterium paraintracellulare]|uniref:hypothetical protein n=1 Tax=Mycobacterium paraintracellulare TaxID=1138383 RepID=UPI001916550F|nr:hypothetical protein [Mycobacterium paraintracellulare]
MTGNADRATFQVAWSDADGEYVGTAVEFGALSHRSSTAQGALAGIQQLVAEAVDRGDADVERGEERHCLVPCLICATTMAASPLNRADPCDGVTIHIFGNYGSVVFDPMDDANWLQAVLCDSCLRSAITAQRVLYMSRSHAPPPPPTYRIATSETLQRP